MLPEVLPHFLALGQCEKKKIKYQAPDLAIQRATLRPRESVIVSVFEDDLQASVSHQ